MMVMSLYGELEARLGGKETTREERLAFQSLGKACGWCRRGTTSGEGDGNGGIGSEVAASSSRSST